MNFARRGPIARSGESRHFVDDLLGELAARRYRPCVWATFMARSLARSARQVRRRPVAAAEVTGYHVLAASRGGRKWAFVSWLLCLTHLGLLGDMSTLRWPNRLTLLRALLPSLASGSRWTSLVALATDFLDGRLARRDSESAFGAFADPIADGAFWSWYALRWEQNRWLRWAPVALFGATTAAITFVYFARGRTIDYPRPEAIRYASGAAQILLTIRTLTSAPT